MTYEEIVKLVSANNQSKEFSNEFVTCLIWKETSFEPSEKNSKSTATGLMQMTKGAVDMVNKCSPKGVHFEHADMTDPVKNVQCGTLYLDIAKNKLGGVDASYGTGPGYSRNIVTCEAGLKGDADHPQVALQKIHS